MTYSWCLGAIGFYPRVLLMQHWRHEIIAAIPNVYLFLPYYVRAPLKREYSKRHNAHF